MNQAMKYGIEMHLFGKRPVRLIRKKLITFVWIRFELIHACWLCFWLSAS